MFNFGFSEMLFLAVIALVVIGPKQLPEVARVIARLLNEFKRATSEVTKPFTDLKSEAQEMAQNARKTMLNTEQFFDSSDLDERGNPKMKDDSGEPKPLVGHDDHADPTNHHENKGSETSEGTDSTEISETKSGDSK